MLLRISNYSELDERQLMDVYAESNYENTDYFYPEEENKAVAVRMVENGFLDYLKNDFFNKAEASYWILEEDGIWISALRICRVQSGLYYLEALETRADKREKGYGSLLLSSVINVLKKEGNFRLCDCVNKKNYASLRVHEKCGFKIISETGYNYLSEETDERYYGLELMLD